MMRTAFSLAVLVAAASALTPEQYARVAVFHGDVVARSAHVEPEVPLEIRGDNFTVPNLVKYFSFEAEPAPEEPARIRGLPKASIDPQTIVQIGKEVWTFIEDNKPVATVNTDFAGAVPSAVGKNWASMAGWRDYAWGRKNPFEWVYKNGFHMTAVDLAWTWEWKCKGSYQGTGSYLTSVGAVSQHLHTIWGQTVTVNATAFSPVNSGTAAAPVAEMDVQLTLKVSNALQDHRQACRITVRGDCSYDVVACDNINVGE